MSYQIFPNIIFIVSVLGIVLIILRRLPEAVAEKQQEDGGQVVQKLSEKGLPALAISQVKTSGKVLTKKLWNFMLEAKDLRPTAVAGYRIKKIFGKQAASAPTVTPAQPTTTQEIRNEQYFLNEIKNNPKDLHWYNELGKFYLDHTQINDAKDVYQYLTKHDPSVAEYWSRLAQCYFKLKDYAKAVENYDKSLQLDSAQPNRFYNKGVGLEALGRYHEAIKAFQSAINLEPSNPKYYVSISNVYIKLGNRNEAKVNLRKVKKLDPDNFEVTEKLKNL